METLWVLEISYGTYSHSPVDQMVVYENDSSQNSRAVLFLESLNNCGCLLAFKELESRRLTRTIDNW